MYGKENLFNEISKENDYEERFYTTKFIDPEHEKRFRTIEGANKSPQILVAIVTLINWVSFVYDSNIISVYFMVITIIVGLIDLILIYILIIKDPNESISVFSSYFKYFFTLTYYYTFILMIAINRETDKEKKIVRAFYIQFILILMNNLFLLKYISFIIKVFTYIGYIIVLFICGYSIFSLKSKYESNGSNIFDVDYSRKCNYFKHFETTKYEEIFSAGKEIFEKSKINNEEKGKNELYLSELINELLNKNKNYLKKTKFNLELSDLISRSIKYIKSNQPTQITNYTQKDLDEIKTKQLSGTIINGYLYIWNNTQLKAILVRGLWQDVTDWQSIPSCTEDGEDTASACFNPLTQDFDLDSDKQNFVYTQILRILNIPMSIQQDLTNDSNESLKV